LPGAIHEYRDEPEQAEDRPRSTHSVSIGRRKPIDPHR
jgi:hypothetical protein